MTETARYAIQRLHEGKKAGEPINWVVDCFVSTAAEIREKAPNSTNVRILDLEQQQVVPYPAAVRPGMARWYPAKKAKAPKA